MASIYDYSVPKVGGGELALADLKGKVIIIVNTATGCGFTPQYKDLEALYEKYHDKGLEIVDIPCNQFAEQAPESDEEIHQFCTMRYNTRFEQMKKSDVNGPNALPVYAYLKECQPFVSLGKGVKAKIVASAYRKSARDAGGENDVRWNFTKFLVDRDGSVVGRFEPTQKMDDLAKAVEALVR